MIWLWHLIVGAATILAPVFMVVWGIKNAPVEVRPVLVFVLGLFFLAAYLWRGTRVKE
jgi:hypothetical protein